MWKLSGMFPSGRRNATVGVSACVERCTCDVLLPVTSSMNAQGSRHTPPFDALIIITIAMRGLNLAVSSSVSGASGEYEKMYVYVLSFMIVEG